MNITLLHYTAPPIIGGVERIIEHHARLMTEHGHRVQIIAGRGSPFDERIPLILIPEVDSRHRAILAMKKSLDVGIVPDSFHEMAARMEVVLHPILESTNILIIHNVCSLNKNLPLTAALQKLSRETPTLQMILWHHDLAWTTPRYQQELHEGYPWDLLKTAWNGVTQVTISKNRRWELAELMQIDERQITVIPNGVDVDRFYKFEEQTREFVEQCDLLDASPLLLLPVRITPRKNIELAIQVLSHLRKRFPKAKLLITGPLGAHNPSNAQYLERLQILRSRLRLDNSVHFLAELTDNYVPDSVISDFYRIADMLFLPSTEEGFGIPILEAGFSGIPVFCSDIPPLRELAGIYAGYFSLDDHPKTIADMLFEHFSMNRVFALRADVQKNYIWQNIYQSKIEPLLGG